MDTSEMKVGVFFNNHEYGGVQNPIISFNIDSYTIRYTIIENKPYFMMTDICRLLTLSKEHASETVKSVAEIISLFKDEFEDENFVYKLYFYLYVDIMQMSNNGPVTQKVRAIFISEHLLNMIIARSKKSINYQYKVNLVRRIYNMVNNN